MMNNGHFLQGRRGLILNQWKFFKGRWGLILNEDLTKNEESSLDPSGFAWELLSFKASRLWYEVNWL
ncbi:hypothetical protein ACFX11_022587 [Malus domestica]